MLQSAAAEKHHQCVQAPLVLEAGRKDKECSQGYDRQDQAEEEEEDDFEEEEDDSEEEATSSGKGQVGPSSQGPRDGSPSGSCLESCCGIKPWSFSIMTCRCDILRTNAECNWLYIHAKERADTPFPSAAVL